MKKLFFLLMILIIPICSYVVCAEEFLLTVDSRTAKCGDTVNIDLDISGNTGIIAAILTLEYDRDRIELIDAQDKGLLDMPVFSSSCDVYPYKMLWNSSSSDDFTKDGTLVTLSFKVRENARSGEAYIRISYNQDDVYNAKLDNVAIKVNNGHINVEENLIYASSSSAGIHTEPTRPVKNNNTVIENVQEDAVQVFSDVDINAWYYNGIKYVAENKLMNGISDSLFSPAKPLTRGMLVTVLYRCEGKPNIDDKIIFSDVDRNMYFSDAVNWAYTNGIANGISDKEFAPERYITRQEIATIFYRYAVYKKYNIQFDSNCDLNIYTDAVKIAEYAEDAVIYAVNSGLLTGKTARTINPCDLSTRAEIATVLMRFNEMYK